VGALRAAAVDAIERIRATRDDLAAISARIERAHAERLRRRELAKDELPLAMESRKLGERLDEIERLFWWSPSEPGIRPETDAWSKLYRVYDALVTTWDPPGEPLREYQRQARNRLGAALDAWNGFEAKELAEFRSRVETEKVELLPQREPIRIP